MKKALISIAIAALAMPMLAQNAAPGRLAVIDVQRVLNTSVAGKAAQDRLKKLQDDKMTKANKLQEDMKALDSEIITKKLSLSEDKLAVFVTSRSSRCRRPSSGTGRPTACRCTRSVRAGSR